METHIDEDVLQDAKSCRALAGDMRRIKAIASFPRHEERLSKAAQLCSLDPSVRLELAFLNGRGARTAFGSPAV